MIQIQVDVLHALRDAASEIPLTDDDAEIFFAVITESASKDQAA